MSYNWERAPSPWERHGKALLIAFSIVIFGALFAWPVFA